MDPIESESVAEASLGVSVDPIESESENKLSSAGELDPIDADLEFRLSLVGSVSRIGCVLESRQTRGVKEEEDDEEREFGIAGDGCGETRGETLQDSG